LGRLSQRAFGDVVTLLLERVGVARIGQVKRPGAHGSELHLSGRIPHITQPYLPGDDPKAGIPVAICVRKDGKDIGRERVITTADLHAHAREPVDVTYVTTRYREVHHVQGVPLHDVLARVELRLDERCKMDHLNFVVLAFSEDGYRVVLSWAEIDPEFGACAALLATRYNGRLLSRPTLVTPRDGRASRFVRGVCRLQLARIA
jgi:hypothetical protein